MNKHTQQWWIERCTNAHFPFCQFCHKSVYICVWHLNGLTNISHPYPVHAASLPALSVVGANTAICLLPFKMSWHRSWNRWERLAHKSSAIPNSSQTLLWLGHIKTVCHTSNILTALTFNITLFPNEIRPFGIARTKKNFIVFGCWTGPGPLSAHFSAGSLRTKLPVCCKQKAAIYVTVLMSSSPSARTHKLAECD